jgi:hypothetical protein
MLEYKIDYTNALDVSLAKQMFDHQLMGNYGHAGPIYADWLVRNREEAAAEVKAVQAKIDRELNLTQRERFWSAVVAANITGGLIAKRYLNIMDWNMGRIYRWATETMLASLREDVKPPATDVDSVVGDYLNRHIHNIVIVNDGVDRRTKLQVQSPILPRGELLIRYEPDTKLLYVNAKHFRNDCVTYQVNYKETLANLKKTGVYVKGDTKRLGKGTDIPGTGVHCLIFNTAAGGFIDVGGIVGVEEQATDDCGGS